MICNQCQAGLAAGTKFCNQCGAKVEAAQQLCIGCGAEFLTNAKFCAGCGAVVAEAPAIAPAVPEANSPAPAPTLSEMEIEQILEQLSEIEDQITPLTEQKNALRAKLTENLPPGTQKFGSTSIKITITNPTFSTAGKREFVKDHPEANFPDLYVDKKELDVAKAMESLTAAEKSIYVTDSKKSLTISKTGQRTL